MSSHQPFQLQVSVSACAELLGKWYTHPIILSQKTLTHRNVKKMTDHGATAKKMTSGKPKVLLMRPGIGRKPVIAHQAWTSSEL